MLHLHYIYLILANYIYYNYQLYIFNFCESSADCIITVLLMKPRLRKIKLKYLIGEGAKIELLST